MNDVGILIREREQHVARVAQIDQRLVEIFTRKVAALPPVPPAPQPPAPPQERTAAALNAAHSPRIGGAIKAALVGKRLLAKEIAEAVNGKIEQVQYALGVMVRAGELVKTAKRGPSVRYELPGAVPSKPKARSEHQVVFPQPGKPQASPREALEVSRR